MSLKSEIFRIKTNISRAYSALRDKGAVLPSVPNSSALADTIDNLSVTGNVIEYNQENPSVGAYLSEVIYDPSDYSVSRLSEYVKPTDYNKSKPSGATVSIPAAGTLHLKDAKHGYTVPVTAGEKTVTNLTPGGTGAYIVENTYGSIVASGALKPRGSLRMIDAQATDNVRDLGGWPCDGGTVKYGMLFRGGEVGAADAALFHDLLGIRAELNLRWDSEVTRDYSLIGDDVDFKHVNGPWCSLNQSASWPEDAHKQIIDYVMDNIIAGKPVYFHCAAGADRTGTAAFFLESILGVSQSDTDKDYELTSFFTGISTDAQARRRNEDEWKNYMLQFNAYSGSTMRDKVLNWMQTIGISLDKINAFRSAMTDGTPGILTNSVGSISVSKSLTGVTSDNTDTSLTKYRAYSAGLTPDPNKVITRVRITMNGVDVTDTAFSGAKTTFRYGVSYRLSHCSVITVPARKAVVSDECFCCEIAADSGYTLDAAIISIKMGGTTLSNCYENGMIHIPRVTGNLVIEVTASESAPTFTNQIAESKSEINGTTVYNATGYRNGYRYNSSYTEVTSDDMFTTGYIYVPVGATIRFYGDVISGASGGANSVIYKADGSRDFAFTPGTFYNHATTEPNKRFGNYVYDDTAHSLKSFVWTKDYPVWIKFTCIGTFNSSDTIITVNEEV